MDNKESCLHLSFTYHREEWERPSDPNTPEWAWTEARELVGRAFVPVELGLGVAAVVVVAVGVPWLVLPPWPVPVPPAPCSFAVATGPGPGEGPGSCRVVPWVEPMAVAGMVLPWEERLRVVLVWP